MITIEFHSDHPDEIREQARRLFGFDDLRASRDVSAESGSAVVTGPAEGQIEEPPKAKRGRGRPRNEPAADTAVDINVDGDPVDEPEQAAEVSPKVEAGIIKPAAGPAHEAVREALKKLMDKKGENAAYAVLAEVGAKGARDAFEQGKAADVIAKIEALLKEDVLS